MTVRLKVRGQTQGVFACDQLAWRHGVLCKDVDVHFVHVISGRYEGFKKPASGKNLHMCPSSRLMTTVASLVLPSLRVARYRIRAWDETPPCSSACYPRCG